MYNEEENIGIIYRYISPSGKSYVGQTTRPNHRKWQHKYNALSMNIKGKFYNAIRKYGWDSFKYEVLYTVYESDEEKMTNILNQQEIYYIGIYNSFENGYNETIGGNQLRGMLHPSYGTHLSEEHTKKLKESVSKKVFQYDLDGNFIAEYNSVISAARQFNTNDGSFLGSCCTTFKLAYGYQWRFYYQDQIEKYIPTKRETKKVWQYSLSGKLLKEWQSVSQACKANGYTQSKIREVCLGKQLAYGKKGEDKYIWSYKKLSKKELSEILNNFE